MWLKRPSKPAANTVHPTQSNRPPARTQQSPYRPLKQNSDFIRLVKIRPAKSESDAIICDLTEVTFQDRPQYDAVSYAWVDTSVRHRITLNDFELAVTNNLFDALHHLRKCGETGFFWVDALCVNQGDVAERTGQLRLMSTIYSRASVVLVWLGQKYVNNQIQLGKARNPSEKQMSEDQLAKDLSEDDYWNRMWTVHDIGNARKLQICYGTQTVSWNAFLAFVKSHNCRNQSVLKLAHQLDPRFAGSHKLQELLYAHRHAVCNDPRDKIYALAGLAADSRGFPVDYNKTVMEVWADTMEFMNQRGMFERDSDIMSLGSLLKFLLCGSKALPTQQLTRSNGLSMIEESQKESVNPKVFSLRGVAIGQILTIGPSLKEITACLKKTDEWNKTVWQNFRDDVSIARQEGDMLLQRVYSNQGKALEGLVFDQVSHVRWMDSTRSVTEQQKTVIGSYISKICAPKHPSATKSRTSEACLFQMHRPQKRTTWRMGITSGQAQQGDIVFWVQGTKKAVLLRVEQRKSRDGSCFRMLQICGTAMVSQDVLGEEANHERRLGSFGKDEELTLRMDSSMIFALLPEGNQN